MSIQFRSYQRDATNATTNERIEFHPIAQIFPMPERSALGEVTADIRKHGLREPIWLYPDGRILDGRNRYLACCQTGVEPLFQTYTGDDPVAFSISLNLHRRHLNESQRAVVAARLANLRQGARTDLKHSTNSDEVPQLSAQDAANRLNVGRDTQINGDQRTAFVWFDVTSFPPTPPILVAQGGASC